MQKIDELERLFLDGDVDGAIRTLKDFSAEILTEHRRRVADEDNYYPCFLTAFVFEAAKGNATCLRALKVLIEEGSFLNETDQSGFSLAALLAHDGLTELLKMAVTAGADVNLGRYPTLCAAVFPVELAEDWVEVCNFLIENGAKVNGTGTGEPPLFHAVARNKIAAVDLLVDKGADLNLVHDFFGDGEELGTALHFAVWKVAQGYATAATIRHLIELGADPMIPSKDWMGAYHFLRSKAERFESQQEKEVRATLDFFSSRAEWMELPLFTCPTCAEKVRYEAKSCRFCGQVLNNAVKKGFPEFYKDSVRWLTLENLKHDYMDHALPGYGGSLTAPSVVGNLLSYGNLDEYDQYKQVLEAMKTREAELAGGELQASLGLPDQTPDYWLTAGNEQRALYLTRRYIQLCQDYTKQFGERDLRQNSENLNWTIEELKKLIALANQAQFPTEDFATPLEDEIERCTDQLGMLGQGRSLSDGNRSAADDITAALAKIEGRAEDRAPKVPESRPTALLWVAGVVVAIIIFATMS